MTKTNRHTDSFYANGANSFSFFFFSISIKPSKFLHKIKEEENKRIGTEFINRNVNYDNLEDD